MTLRSYRVWSLTKYRCDVSHLFTFPLFPFSLFQAFPSFSPSPFSRFFPFFTFFFFSLFHFSSKRSDVSGLVRALSLADFHLVVRLSHKEVDDGFHQFLATKCLRYALERKSHHKCFVATLRGNGCTEVVFGIAHHGKSS